MKIFVLSSHCGYDVQSRTVVINVVFIILTHLKAQQYHDDKHHKFSRKQNGVAIFITHLLSAQVTLNVSVAQCAHFPCCPKVELQ